MKTKMILLDVMKNETKVVEVEGLEDYYKLIGCNLVDIVARQIGRKSKWFNIICDDEGTFVQDPKISAIDNFGQAMLVGNLLIAGAVDEEGRLESLTTEEIRYIKERIQVMSTRKHPEGYMMLTQCEY